MGSEGPRRPLGPVAVAPRVVETGPIMPLRYDPQHALGAVPKPGVYAFEVLACEEVDFKTGSHGIRLQLAIDLGGLGGLGGSGGLGGPGGDGAKRAPLRITDRVVFSEKSTWKMLDLCKSTGVRFDPPSEAEDFVGKHGRARFEIDEREGLTTLKVDRYLPPPGTTRGR